MNDTMKFNLNITAPLEQVYRAFTNATILRQWFCDFATTEPKPGGRFYIWWQSGRYLVGEFKESIQNKKIKIVCRGRNECDVTEISINLESKPSSTHLKLMETGFTDQKVFDEIKMRWDQSLKNLKSYLEEGLDLRFINRPMLGIVFGDFNEKVARELSVPVDKGIRLTEIVKGLAAEKAGLTKNDVITNISGSEITGFGSLLNVLRQKSAGDQIEVSFYRGKTLHKISFSLSKRPVPKVAKTPKALAKSMSTKYKEIFKALTSCFKGFSEAQTSKAPKKGEWSANEVLAHLIQTEHFWQDWVSDMIFNQERVSDGFGDNLPARIKATVEVHGSSKELLKEFQRAQQETIHFISNLPNKISENKGNFWLIAYNMTQFGIHADEHLDQIKSALKTGK